MNVNNKCNLNNNSKNNKMNNELKNAFYFVRKMVELPDYLKISDKYIFDTDIKDELTEDELNYINECNIWIDKYIN